MKIKFTKYLKDASSFHKMEEPIEMEMDAVGLADVIKFFGFKEIKPNHFWRRTAYDQGETLDVITE